MKIKHAKIFQGSVFLVTVVVTLLAACGGGSDSPGDTTAPTVTATIPVNGASGVGVRTTLSATFSEALNATSVGDTSFTLMHGASSVAGTVSYSGTTATFTPTSQLSFSTTYTATLTTGVKDVAGNALAGNYTLTFTTHVAPLNDTGIDPYQCYKAGTSVVGACTDADRIALSPTQDGMQGRDANAATNSYSDGVLGFSFTKIDAVGAALPDSATTWSCVKDNVTGLIWENKTDGGLRDWTVSYTNYDSTTALQKWNGASYVAPTQAEIDAPTNSVGFKNAVNSAGLCGASDWRLPTADELQGLVINGPVAVITPVIDGDWFPTPPRPWDLEVLDGYAGCRCPGQRMARQFQQWRSHQLRQPYQPLLCAVSACRSGNSGDCCTAGSVPRWTGGDRQRHRTDLAALYRGLDV
jgi:hypothetical protein